MTVEPIPDTAREEAVAEFRAKNRAEWRATFNAIPGSGQGLPAPIGGAVPSRRLLEKEIDPVLLERC
jgi:hypothetical protein